MLKKVLTSALCLVIVFSFFMIGAKPVFSKYAKTFNVYLSDSKSSQFYTVDEKEFMSFNNIKGESIIIEDKAFNLADLLDYFNAKILLTEYVEHGVSYYAYSPKIKYRASICGKNINLHVFIGEGRTVVGAPLIYGSF